MLIQKKNRSNFEEYRERMNRKVRVPIVRPLVSSSAREGLRTERRVLCGGIEAFPHSNVLLENDLKKKKFSIFQLLV